MKTPGKFILSNKFEANSIFWKNEKFSSKKTLYEVKNFAGRNLTTVRILCERCEWLKGSAVSLVEDIEKIKNFDPDIFSTSLFSEEGFNMIKVYQTWIENSDKKEMEILEEEYPEQREVFLS